MKMHLGVVHRIHGASGMANASALMPDVPSQVPSEHSSA